MKRRSYLSSRESRSSLHHDSRNVRAIPRLKNIFSSDDLYSFFLSKNRKFAGRKWPRRGGEERRVRWSSLDREYRRDTFEISRRIRIIRRRVKQEGDERIVPLVSEIQSMCRIECR